MQLVQFVVPGSGRRVGLISQSQVMDLTSGDPSCGSVFDLAQKGFAQQLSLQKVVENVVAKVTQKFSYRDLLKAAPGLSQPYLLPPVDHPEPAKLLISGTGLSHLGSVQSRDQMHGGTAATEPQTDSARMFAMGLQGGRPTENCRGTAPEWFYKGNGHNLRGPNQELDIPEYALDGGEEPEIVGCYLIDPSGQPRRLGFVLGNEWSDHATEKINYLYLAPSKLRSCAIGPSLQVTEQFAEIRLRCSVLRGGEQIYDSGELFSGEQHMCHSLNNLEDHHFKYAQHRYPGDLHLHFFGTSKLSFGSRSWKYQSGDVIEISAPGFCEPLTNLVTAHSLDKQIPLRVTPA